ncbi:unnamed protein product [Phytomonas sp. EM1]|nr:unnamed protein product [Phytomonas sp. EM1]|eukprot:CCW64812.1 unnamed protein product [Phytomonas sp. isolate EM1]
MCYRSCLSGHSCSWEVPYDFTPRIHQYHGVECTVLRPWTASYNVSSSLSRAEKNHTIRVADRILTLERGKQEKGRTPRTQRQSNLSGESPQEKRAEYDDHSSMQSKGFTSGLGETSCPHSEVFPSQAPQESSPPPPTKTQLPPSQDDTVDLSEEQAQKPVPSAVEGVSKALRKLFMPNPPSKPPTASPQKRAARWHAGKDVEMLLRGMHTRRSLSTTSRTDESTKGDRKAVQMMQSTLTRAPSSNRHKYQPRTQMLYTLPANYSQRLRWIRAHAAQPRFVHEGSYASRHASQSELNTVRVPRSESRRLSNWYRYLSKEAPWLVSDRLREGPSAFTQCAGTPGVVPLRDYNSIVPDLYEGTISERLASLREVEQRMFGRLIAGVVPVAGALGDDDDNAVVMRGGDLAVTGVLDDGHLDSAIVLCNGRLLRRRAAVGASSTGLMASSARAEVPRGDVDGGEEEEADGDESEESPTGVALLVKPFLREVCARRAPMVSGVDGVVINADMEKRRTLLKGREWDRQRAIRDAAGTTAQEAIIDLRLDPRYRRPGEYVRWRYNKARRSMQVVP